MGSHAFASMPGQAARLQCVYPEIINEGLFGIAQGWDIPVALWRAGNGFDAFYPGNAHNTLSFIVAGASIQRIDGRFAGRRGYAEPASFMLYSGGGSRRYASQGNVRLCHLYFQPILVQDIAANDCDKPIGGRELRDDRIFARDLELRRLVDHYVSRATNVIAPPTLLEMDACTLLLVMCLLRHHSNIPETERPSKGGLAPCRLAAVLEYVEANLVENVSLAELAQVAKLSRRHFCGAFDRSIGMTPHKYVMARRIERAKLLMAGSSSLVEIALDCGFASQQHFTAAFHQAVGQPPGAARAAMR